MKNINFVEVILLVMFIGNILPTGIQSDFLSWGEAWKKFGSFGDAIVYFWLAFSPWAITIFLLGWGSGIIDLQKNNKIIKIILVLFLLVFVSGTIFNFFIYFEGVGVGIYYVGAFFLRALAMPFTALFTVWVILGIVFSKKQTCNP